MARAATTADAFNAVAETRRRDILAFLADGEHPVGAIVAALGLEQASVSKHLKVLRAVDLVRARRDGRRMFYRTNAQALRPLHEWTAQFSRLWQHQLLRVKERAEAEEKTSPKEMTYDHPHGNQPSGPAHAHHRTGNPRPRFY